MTTTASPIPRALAGAISLAAFGALALQTTINEGSVIENFGGMARFFTIWGNIAACLVMGWIAAGRHASRGVLASLATSLSVIALVYWGLLAGDHNPVGLDRVTNQFHHTIIPATVIAWWLAYTAPAPRALALVPAIMVPPLIYGAFAFALGEMTGFYAYFFLDLPALGWSNFLINNAGLALFFGVHGFLLVKAKSVINQLAPGNRGTKQASA